MVGEGSWEAAISSVGSVLDAVDLSVGGSHLRSFCAVRPPGHHALADRSMGFCIFGNVAIGANYAKTRHKLERILIIDWDVHHGNGTQALVEADPDIRFVSMHQWPWYPGTGARSDRGPHQNVWNIALSEGLSPERYVSELNDAVAEATYGWRPDLIFISAGFDSMANDPLGGFTLQNDHITQLTAGFRALADSLCGGRLISVLEGGYNTDVLGAASVAHLRALAL